MPCDSIVTIGVNLNLANRQLILAALEKLGAKYVQSEGANISFVLNNEDYELRNGKLEGYSNVQAVADKLKVAYTREAVSMAAKRAGWNVEVKSESKLAVQRRC